MSTQPGHHWLDREDRDSVTVVRFRLTRLDEAHHEAFGLLLALVDEAGRANIVLNMGRVEFVDSFAIGKLVLLNHKAQAAGGRLTLCRLGPAVQRALESLRLIETFALYPEEQQALESFPPAGSADEGNMGG